MEMLQGWSLHWGRWGVDSCWVLRCLAIHNLNGAEFFRAAFSSRWADHICGWRSLLSNVVLCILPAYYLKISGQSAHNLYSDIGLKFATILSLTIRFNWTDDVISGHPGRNFQMFLLTWVDEARRHLIISIVHRQAAIQNGRSHIPIPTQRTVWERRPISQTRNFLYQTSINDVFTFNQIPIVELFNGRICCKW